MNDRGESSTSGSSNVMSFLTDSRNKTVKKKVNRKTLTGLEKQSLCIKAQKHPNITLEALAIEFGIKPNTVHDILAEKDIWLALDKNSPLANSKRRGFLPLSQHSLCGLNMLYIMNKLLLVKY